MFSILNPDFVYTDVSEDITETDIDVVSDLWNMDGREVYRGSRDPRYLHANVYWLYDEDLKRVGCSEHSIKDHADFNLLWFRDNEFGTLLQEDGWTSNSDIWSIVPHTSFERFLNEGWTAPLSFLEHCLHGPTRILTPSMIQNRPSVYVCNACGRKSLRPVAGCAIRETEIDFPDKQKILFVDNDLILYLPPKNSSVWSRLRLQPGDDSSQQALTAQAQQAQAQAPQQPEPQPESPLQTSLQPQLAQAPASS